MPGEVLIKPGRKHVGEENWKVMVLVGFLDMKWPAGSPC